MIDRKQSAPKQSTFPVEIISNWIEHETYDNAELLRVYDWNVRSDDRSDDRSTWVKNFRIIHLDVYPHYRQVHFRQACAPVRLSVDQVGPLRLPLRAPRPEATPNARSDIGIAQQ